jgi:hypothetical protein
LVFPGTAVYDAKTYGGNLFPTNQIRGFIEVAAGLRERVYNNTPYYVPTVTFLTTSDTVVTSGILDEANRRGVAIRQSYAYEKCRGFPPGTIELSSQFDYLNKYIYAEYGLIPSPSVYFPGFFPRPIILM